jgi:hypothetical protein
MNSVAIERSKRGLPVIWESGGSYTNRGGATLVAGSSGEMLPAIFVRHGGNLACGQHALIPVEVGNLILNIGHRRGDYSIEINRIVGFERKTETSEVAIVELVAEYSQGEWDKDYPLFDAFVNAAKRKVGDYHCRSAYYIIEPKKEN